LSRDNWEWTQVEFWRCWEKTSWNIGVQNILLTFSSKVEFFSNLK
jgi:hypothetical protein